MSSCADFPKYSLLPAIPQGRILNIVFEDLWATLYKYGFDYSQNDAHDYDKDDVREDRVVAGKDPDEESDEDEENDEEEEEEEEEEKEEDEEEKKRREKAEEEERMKREEELKTARPCIFVDFPFDEQSVDEGPDGLPLLVPRIRFNFYHRGYLEISSHFRYYFLDFLRKKGLFMHHRPTWRWDAVAPPPEYTTSYERALGSPLLKHLRKDWMENVAFYRIKLLKPLQRFDPRPARKAVSITNLKLFTQLKAVYVDGSCLPVHLPCMYNDSEAGFDTIISNWEALFKLFPEKLIGQKKCKKCDDGFSITSPRIYVSSKLKFNLIQEFRIPASLPRPYDRRSHPVLFKLTPVSKRRHKDCLDLAYDWFDLNRQRAALATTDGLWNVFEEIPENYSGIDDNVIYIHIWYNGKEYYREYFDYEPVWPTFKALLEDLDLRGDGKNLPNDYIVRSGLQTFTENDWDDGSQSESFRQFLGHGEDFEITLEDPDNDESD